MWKPEKKRRAWTLVAIVGVGVAAAVFLWINRDDRPTRERVLDAAMEWHQQQSRFLAEPLLGSDDRLRGLDYVQANAIMDKCDEAKDWKLLGEEERSAHDCQLFAVYKCDQLEGSVIARIWAESVPGDRLSDLQAWSDFLACVPGSCPDFAAGEPRTDGVSTCETAYKVRPVGESIVKQ